MMDWTGEVGRRKSARSLRAAGTVRNLYVAATHACGEPVERRAKHGPISRSALKAAILSSYLLSGTAIRTPKPISTLPVNHRMALASRGSPVSRSPILAEKNPYTP